MKSRKKFSLLDANDDDLITFGEWEWGTLLRQWGLNLTTGMGWAGLFLMRRRHGIYRHFFKSIVTAAGWPIWSVRSYC